MSEQGEGAEWFKERDCVYLWAVCGTQEASGAEPLAVCYGVRRKLLAVSVLYNCQGCRPYGASSAFPSIIFFFFLRHLSSFRHVYMHTIQLRAPLDLFGLFLMYYR